jgi:pimeloyl-ACP methyl ester carboxylesterase
MSHRLTLLLLLALSIGLTGFSLSEAGVRGMVRQLKRLGLVEAVFTDAALGHQLRYFDRQVGEPLLMLHGFGGDGVVTWRGQAKGLADSHRVIIPDLLWFGDSTSTAPRSLTTQAQAQLALLDHLGIEKTDVMGISYGGFVLLQMALIAPERIGRIILVDSPGPVFSEADIQSLLQRFEVEQPADIFLPDTPEQVKTIMALTYHKPPPMPRLLLRDIQRNLFNEHRAEQHELLDDLPRNRTEISPEMLQTLGEIFIVWGENDPIFPLESGQLLAETLGADLHVIPDANHGPNVEHPEAFNTAVRDFLDRTHKH